LKSFEESYFFELRLVKDHHNNSLSVT